MLQEKYQSEIQPKLLEELTYNNPLAVPRVVKVVINMGVGQAKEDERELEAAMDDLKLIAGQQGVATKARRAISGFGIQKGRKIGAKVTLRGRRMYEFLDKLFNLVLPRTRDFHGLPKRGFDGQGNYSLGLEEQGIFLEIDPNKINKARGLQVTIVTTAKTDIKAERLLTELGLPLERGENIR